MFRLKAGLASARAQARGYNPAGVRRGAGRGAYACLSAHGRTAGDAEENELATEDSGQEGQEVERLRREVSDLKAQLDQAREAAPPAPAEAPKPRRGWRAPVAAILIVLACVLAPVSVVAVWTANEVSNTDKYVANVSPLITQPTIRRALTDRISTSVSDQINVQGLTRELATELSSLGRPKLGSLLSSFSGTIASGVDGFIHSAVAKVVASHQVQRLWVQGNRVVHQQLVLALSGQKSSITVSHGQVVVGLGPIIDQVKHDLADRGLTIVSKLPPINPTFPLFSAKYLVQAQTLYRVLNTLKWVLPIVALLCFAAGVYIAKRHRRALVGAGLGLAASMLVLGLLLALGRSVYLSKLPPNSSADAAAVAFDTIVRFIRQGLRVLLVLGLVVAIAAFFSGPSVTAVRTRGAFTSAFAAIRRAGERAGVTTGAFGEWVRAHRNGLRIGAVAVAALIFVFLGNPTGLTVLVIALVLLFFLGLIELIGRPPARHQPASK
jgi:hypothetical protein